MVKAVNIPDFYKIRAARPLACGSVARNLSCMAHDRVKSWLDMGVKLELQGVETLTETINTTCGRCP